MPWFRNISEPQKSSVFLLPFLLAQGTCQASGCAVYKCFAEIIRVQYLCLQWGFKHHRQFIGKFMIGNMVTHQISKNLRSHSQCCLQPCFIKFEQGKKRKRKNKGMKTWAPRKVQFVMQIKCTFDQMDTQTSEREQLNEADLFCWSPYNLPCCGA